MIDRHSIVPPLIFGVVTTAILLSLGIWQLRRMEWKETLISEIQAGIDADPQPLPSKIDPSMKYMPVFTTGRTTGEEILVLSGTKERGGGYNVISGFITDDGRRIMLDRGFVDQGQRHSSRPQIDLTVSGNLHWPDEKGSATPSPDLKAGVWFARDVPAMAEVLKTEPVLIVVSGIDGDAQGILPIPVSVEGIPNNHLSYAIQWFLFAITCVGMTAWFIWRIRHRTY